MGEIENIIGPIKMLSEEFAKFNVAALAVDSSIADTSASINMMSGILASTLNAVRDVAISTAYLAQIVSTQMIDSYSNASIGVNATSSSIQALDANIAASMTQVQQLSTALQGMYAATNNNIIQVSVVAPLQQAAPLIKETKENTAWLTVENINAALTATTLASAITPLSIGVGALAIGIGMGVKELVDFMGSTEEANGLLLDIQNTLSFTAGGFWGLAEGAFGAIKGFTDGITTVYKMNEAIGHLGTVTDLLTDAKKRQTIVQTILTNATKVFDFVVSNSRMFLFIGLIMAAVAAVYFLWQRFEGLRKIVFAVWEVAKYVFKNIVDLATSCVDVWSKVIEVIVAIFKNPFNAGEIISTAVDEVTAKFKGIWDGLGVAIDVGVAKGEESFKQSQEEKKNGAQGADPLANLQGPPAGIINPQQLSGGAQVNQAASIGNSRTINVRVESLVKEINIFSNVKESAQEVRNLIRDELVAAVRDFEKTPSYG